MPLLLPSPSWASRNALVLCTPFFGNQNIVFLVLLGLCGLQGCIWRRCKRSWKGITASRSGSLGGARSGPRAFLSYRGIVRLMLSKQRRVRLPRRWRRHPFLLPWARWRGRWWLILLGFRVWLPRWRQWHSLLDLLQQLWLRPTL